MKTIGTHVEVLTDADLRTYIGALALDVYEAVLIDMGNYEVAFAVGTLERFTAELQRRVGNHRLDPKRPGGFLG